MNKKNAKKNVLKKNVWEKNRTKNGNKTGK